MRRSDPLLRAARAAIGRAKRGRRTEVTPDDLLIGALGEIARFGIAQVGPWTLDVTALEGNDAAPGADGGSDATGGPNPGDGAERPGSTEAADTALSGPRYAEAAVADFEAAAVVAREEGAESLELVHLLVALGERDDGLMARLRERHGFTPTEWRAALARGELGPPATHGEFADEAGPTGTGDRVRAPELLSVDQAAAFLGVHAQTVRNYIRAGKLPAYRLAGERFIRVLRRDLLALLEPVGAEDAQEEEASEVELPVNLSPQEG